MITELVHGIGPAPGSHICDMMEANRQLNRLIMDHANGNSETGMTTGFDTLRPPGHGL